ncbi:MAG: YjgP/YjgQ family permease [Candidatus Nealsonbacteria bacterium]|nr:YjgP/YjgQ family permease [Candidatus Nealsonbacteria bacterium]
MRILQKYVLLELTKIFLISLAGLTMMMIVVGLVREATMQNLPLGQVMRLIPFVLPAALCVAVPVTLLLATTTVYGRMSGANEIIAAKALGISPMVLLWPVMAVAVLLSVITIWLNDVSASWGRNGARRVVVEAVEDIAYSMLRAQRRYSSPNFTLNVKRVEGRKLILPTVTFRSRGGSQGVTVTAEEAELQSDRQANMLKIILRNGTLDVDGRVTVQFPDVYEQEIPLREASRARNVNGLASWMPLQTVFEELDVRKDRIEQLEQELAAEAAYQMLCGDFQDLAAPQWDNNAYDLRFVQGQLYRLQTEPHRRFSAGFSCLCFAFIGAPMAIRRRKSDFLTIFFLCFLPILTIYYPLLVYGVDAAKSGSIPPYAVWTGNILLLAWGAWMMRRVIRY